MLISRIEQDGQVVLVAREEGEEPRMVREASSLRDLALEAAASGKPLAEHILSYGLGVPVDLERAYAEGRMLLPISHDDPAHLHLTGTGLTHLGSASTRNAMHAGNKAEMTDSMKMFQMGLENGKPAGGGIGAQPEWFYKGNGTNAVTPGGALVSPEFAEDGGEEPELAGIYVIGPDARPCRIGMALANEFSDHVTERVNYLWLAHSKLRPCSFGPEILIGEPPRDVRGMSRILRGGQVIWEKPFLSGEDNMSHTLANLEHHHFKYGLFRQPGDIHVHMFGTATLSFADNVRTQNGDIFEIEAPGFGLPLRNELRTEEATGEMVRVRQL